MCAKMGSSKFVLIAAVVAVVTISLMVDEAEGTPLYFPRRRHESVMKEALKVIGNCPEGSRMNARGQCRKVWSADGAPKRKRRHHDTIPEDSQSEYNMLYNENP
ncbi:uncharacterized protein LOC143911884 [Arctopsyche grandis]|uniref:uncharacterized protein LOC143911884 n=1 Tax=Arctopsyche grandis TaxID=121162 RepID=UPI00406D7BCF